MKTFKQILVVLFDIIVETRTLQAKYRYTRGGWY